MSNPVYVIGINGGATHTDLVLIDSNLNVKSRVSTGPTNFRNIGVEAALATLQQAINEVAKPVGIDSVSGLCACLAGVDTAGDEVMMRRELADRFPAIPAANILIANDAAAALYGGAGQGFGIVIISGTGSICGGMNADGKWIRAGGQGKYIDLGSGYDIAQATLKAVWRADDSLAPETKLTAAILNQLGLSDLDALMDWLYDADRQVDEIAALAKATISLGESDPVAREILVRAADSLAEYVITVAHRLGLEKAAFPLLLSGGVFTNSELLRNLFSARISWSLPKVVIIKPHFDAPVGAALIALDAMHVKWPVPPLPDPVPQLRRPSEQRNRLSIGITPENTADLLAIMSLEDSRIPPLIETQLKNLETLIVAVAERFNSGGRIIFAGAGASGRLAVMDAVECVPTFSARPDQVIALFAGGERALANSIEDAEDNDESGAQAIAALNVNAQDCVIGVAASGSTPFVIGALREANQRSALTGCIVNAPDSPIEALSQFPMVIVTGPEVITGSTRLKAGTAQKMALNMLTTGVFVRLGRTYNHLMVNVHMTNSKLQHRASVIVSDATALSIKDSAALLARCDYDIKTAIVSFLTNTSPEMARQRLESAGGNINALL